MATTRAEENYVCVRCAGQFFWLPAAALDHIMAGEALRRALTREDAAPFPTAELEGERIRVYSLRALLGFPPWGGERHALLLAAAGRRSGLLVDEVTETVSAPADAILPLPAPARSPENAFLRGVVWMEARGTLAYLLDAPLPTASGGEAEEI